MQYQLPGVHYGFTNLEQRFRHRYLDLIMNGKQYKYCLVLLACPNLARFDSRSVFDEIQNREPAKSVPK